MAYKCTTIKSKWTKNNWLLSHPELSKHLPHTLKFNKENLSQMLSLYKTVYFKPTNGSGGVNIIRIKSKKEGYQTHHNTSKKIHSSINQLYDYLHHFAKKRPFLLQKGITLIKTNNKPFDTRVMVQKTNTGKWVSTALFTKIGKPGKVATNYNQGRKVDLFPRTMANAGFDSTTTKEVEIQLKALGTAVGKAFDKRMDGFRELGLDVAIDKKLRIWILEVNTRPQFYPLKQLKDQSLYKRILSYSKQYGRKK